MANELATCDVLSTDMLCDDHEGSRSSGNDEERDDCDPDLMPSFREAHAAYGTVRFFYVHSSSEHGEQNILSCHCFT